MPIRDPKRRISELPEWPDDFVEPERPQVYLREDACPDDIEIVLAMQDPRSAEWLAHWLNSKACWMAFGDWLDTKR